METHFHAVLTFKHFDYISLRHTAFFKIKNGAIAFCKI